MRSVKDVLITKCKGCLDTVQYSTGLLIVYTTNCGEIILMRYMLSRRQIGCGKDVEKVWDSVISIELRIKPTRRIVLYIAITRLVLS